MSNYGKFVIPREIFESDVWGKPPSFVKIWIWIIGNANYKEVKKGGQTYFRGEFLTTYQKIIDANKWSTGWRSEKLTKDQVSDLLSFLRKTKRITTWKTTRGLFIKVMDYDDFQTLPRSEADTEANAETDRTATEDRYYKSNKENKEKELSGAELRSANFPLSGAQPPEAASPEDHSKKADRDPRVKQLIDIFSTYCQDIRGFSPRINGAVEGKMIKDYLREYSIDDLSEEFDWFLKEDLSDKLGCTIKIALSNFVFNKWLYQREANA